MQCLRRNLSSASNSFASTSSLTLDQPFDHLLPASTSTSTSTGRRPRRHRQRLSETLDLPTDPLPSEKRTTFDPTQVSPYLPQNTREKNHLLASFRQTLYPHSTSPRPQQHVSPDATWSTLASVLRYPAEQVPHLPPSHFPTSTRSAPTPSSSSSMLDTFDPSFSIGSAQKINLSTEELRRTFSILASQTPRTRTGLQRLLVVVELLARQSGSNSTVADISSSLAEPAGGSVETLPGGGAALSNTEWRQLILFVGTNLRATRPDPETKSVLSLFAQQQELKARDKVKGKASATVTREDTKLYNALLHIAQRSRMWELFDQILERMESESIPPDAATYVAKMQREDQRGSSIEVIWNLFQQGFNWTVVDNDRHVGKRARKESRKVLCNAYVWMLARRARFEESSKFLEVMRSQETVQLDHLAPEPTTMQSFDPAKPYGFSESAPTRHSVPNRSLQVRLPAPDERLYTSLIQAYAFQGHLKESLGLMVSMIQQGPYPALPLHFHELFKAFAKHGRTTSSEGDAKLDWLRLKGTISNNSPQSRQVHGRNPLAVLAGTSKGVLAHRQNTRDAQDDEFSPQALETIFESFLSLEPPAASAAISTVRPFEGQRTAPSPKTIYFVLRAFETAWGPTRLRHEPELILREVWKRLEGKFGPKREQGQGLSRKHRWTGWKMDKRVTRLVERYRAAAADKERLIRELV
ncbi:uncharacterized protein JCM15063_000888 [Sporobolomyces koalae]|uniref:uncharacterized protein n=1 Tax=Sporobolomyces koalae TaxID=500713 RepID=UPI00317923BF